MNLGFIPLVTALLPVIAVHLCYLLAAYLGHLSWCFPYFADCVSISATGRHAPESFVFRAAVIPTAVLMMIYWKLSAEWLKALGSQSSRLNRLMLSIGITAALGLFIYAAVLGEAGDLYRLQRRIGMILFYVLTFIAQLLMTVQVVKLAKTRDAETHLSSTVLRALTLISGAVAVLGAMSFLSWGFYADYRRYEDAFEWVVTLLILAHPFVTYFAWRETCFSARFTLGRRLP